MSPDQGDLVDVATLADLLHETADHHGAFEAVAPPHDWWDWYAPYLHARLRGSTSEEAKSRGRPVHEGRPQHRPEVS